MPQRIAVQSPYSNIKGGYIERKEHDGHATYAKDISKGGTVVWIFHESRFGSPGWYFGKELPTGRSLSSFFKSDSDARSPTSAKWPKSEVEEISTVDERGGSGDSDFPGMFKDGDFPHEKSSLGSRIKLDHEPVWIPARNLRRGRWHLFDGIDPNDLLQGALGNCWLVAALASLAEFPNEVRKLFVTTEIPADGRYTLRLYDHKTDKFIEMVVDEYIPCHPKHWWDKEGKPLFAHPNGNEVWVLLIEKAMAKLFGSYEDLIGGCSATAFRTFTGEKNTFGWEKEGSVWKKLTLSPKKLHQFTYQRGRQEEKRHNDFFHYLQESDQSNFMICASIDVTSAREHVRPDGLVEGHAYSLLHVMQVEGLKLLCLRNPWGNDKEWNGDWSDDSKTWDKYPKVKARLRPRMEDDGCFWMSWDDFCRIWDSIYICCKAMRTGDEAMMHTKAGISGSVMIGPPKPIPASRTIVKHKIPSKRIGEDGKEEPAVPPPKPKPAVPPPKLGTPGHAAGLGLGLLRLGMMFGDDDEDEDEDYKGDIDEFDSMLFKTGLFKPGKPEIVPDASPGRPAAASAGRPAAPDGLKKGDRVKAVAKSSTGAYDIGDTGVIEDFDVRGHPNIKWDKDGQVRTANRIKVQVVPARPAAASSSPGYEPSARRGSWSFETGHGNKEFAADCQGIIEKHYVAWKGGSGHSRIKVITQGMSILVDFKAMTQEVEGRGRKRRISRAVA